MKKAINSKAKTQGVKRSPKWPALRRKWLKKFSACAYCLGEVSLEVHHVLPFHLFPARELDETNLMTLCEAKGKNCHLNIGHLGSWAKYNKKVQSECLAHRREITRASGNKTAP